MQFFLKKRNFLGIAVLLLGIVALYVYVDKKSNVESIDYDDVGFKYIETNSTSTKSNLSRDSDSVPVNNPTTTNDTDLNKKEEPQKITKKDEVQDSVKTIPQNIAPIENNNSQKSEDQPYEVVSDRVVATPGNVFPDELLVKYHMIILTMKSPVDLQIYDDQGNHTGIIRKNGQLPYAISNIPGSTIDRVSGHQVITLQGDRLYNVVLDGMSDADNINDIDNESFLLEAEIFYGEDLVKEILFSAPPTSPQSKGNITISPENSFSSLELDYDGDGQVDSVIEPTDSE